MTAVFVNEKIQFNFWNSTLKFSGKCGLLYEETHEDIQSIHSLWIYLPVYTSLRALVLLVVTIA